MALKVLIADDDIDIRMVLKKITARMAGFEFIGEAGDGDTAFRLAESFRPHIVFMDVEMPGIDGVECARRIASTSTNTFFIFVTAHEEYMQDAFHLYAADYLIKPFKLERVEQTLNRIQNMFCQPEALPFEKITPRSSGLGKLLIHNKEGISLVDLQEIILIQREERNTAIYTADQRYLTAETLSELEERLDKTTFFRSHKSYIINLTMVRQIYPYGRWTYLIKLKNTQKDALITHERYEDLKTLFSA
jgi:two-component system LytT family response regulator